MMVEHPVPTHESRIHGCLLGGALGDSRGYAAEPEAAGTGAFSARTQMTLYTVDGLLEALEWANSGVAADTNACLWLAYLRWLGSQGEVLPDSAPFQPPRWIDSHEVLRQRRAPAAAALSGLATGEMGTLQQPVNPDSKDSGTVPRSAPFGLVPNLPADTVYKLSADAAALTHGHPAARQSAGAFSLLIRSLTLGSGLPEAADVALSHLAEGTLPRGEAPDAAVLDRLTASLRLAKDTNDDGAVMAAGGPATAPGGGNAAEEVLAVALYAVLATAQGEAAAAAPEEHFRAAIAAALGHGGDSASAASIAGNILGAYYGEACLPADWLALLEAPDLIRGMAGRLVEVTGA